MLLTKDFLARLATLEIVSRRLRRGEFRGERRSVRRGSSVEFADHRPYGAGDDLRFLDWNLYARLEVLMTKLFHDEEDLSIHLILDRSASMEFGDPTKALHAKRILAAIGYVSLLGNHRVSLWSPGAAGDVDVRDLRSARSAARLFEAIEAAPVGGASGLDEPLRRWVGTRRPRGVLVLASDLLHRDGAWEHLRVLVRGGLESHCVRVLSPQEIEPAIEGDLRLIDAEDASGIDISVTPRLLRLYHEARAAYDRRLDEFCRSRAITLVATTTAEPFEAIVLDVLRSKGLLQ
ncbi:MAG: DUF58 domain-containing protein [Planctomycetes bacterium]|nr:DUF58 domain-containing protein [Planctomycetota bacterium]